MHITVSNLSLPWLKTVNHARRSGYPVRQERLSVLEIQYFPIKISIAIESRAHLFML